MIVVDTSALVAIVAKEELRTKVLEVLLGPEPIFLSAVTIYEAGVVLLGRLGEAAVAELHNLLSAIGATVVSFDAVAASASLEAYRLFGKGRHPARLNLADCPVYALAKDTHAPILFVGRDFNETGIDSALQF